MVAMLTDLISFLVKATLAPVMPRIGEYIQSHGHACRNMDVAYVEAMLKMSEV
jgi:hypothetical protein